MHTSRRLCEKWQPWHCGNVSRGCLIKWAIEKMLAGEQPEDGRLASKTLKAVGVNVSTRVCSGTYRGHY